MGILERGFVPASVPEMPTEVATPLHEDDHVPYAVGERFQVGGNHYQASLQPFDIIRELNLDFFEGNALKYLLRYKHKNGAEDLLKAQHYIDILIAREKGVKEWWKTPPRQ